jgi:hypothetical protein
LQSSLKPINGAQNPGRVQPSHFLTGLDGGAQNVTGCPLSLTIIVNQYSSLLMGQFGLNLVPYARGEDWTLTAFTRLQMHLISQ